MSAADPQELREARALWLQDRHDEALVKFDAVLAAHPDHPLALIDAARAFGGCYRIAKAEALVDRYLATAGRSAATLAMAGQTCRMIHCGRKALDCVKESAALAAPDPATGLELAMLLDRGGEMEAADAVLSGLLARHPSFAEGR
jgi:thioredoxin-like negative regulator of GroEL